MAWFRIDDTLGTHPKARAAGLAAMGLWTLAGSWASQQLTDGHVPEWFVADLKASRHAAKLVEVGLWHPSPEGGWVFHEWAEMNPTRAEVEEKREAARKRMRDLRARGLA